MGGCVTKLSPSNIPKEEKYKVLRWMRRKDWWSDFYNVTDGPDWLVRASIEEIERRLISVTRGFFRFITRRQGTIKTDRNTTSLTFSKYHDTLDNSFICGSNGEFNVGWRVFITTHNLQWCLELSVGRYGSDVCRNTLSCRQLTLNLNMDETFVMSI